MASEHAAAAAPALAAGGEHVATASTSAAWPARSAWTVRVARRPALKVHKLATDARSHNAWRRELGTIIARRAPPAGDESGMRLRPALSPSQA